MGYDVNISRLGINAVIELQGTANAIAAHVEAGFPAFPKQPNTASQQAQLMLCWVAPERWLLRSSLDHEARLLAMTKPSQAPSDLSIVQISDSLQFFAITGPAAEDIISIASSIDHHAAVFPANGVSYTDVFGIKGLLFRRPNGFEIAVESSYADLIEDYLGRANA